MKRSNTQNISCQNGQVNGNTSFSPNGSFGSQNLSNGSIGSQNGFSNGHIEQGGPESKRSRLL